MRPWGVYPATRKRHCPRATAIQPCHKGRQILAHGARSVLRCAAVQVGTAAGSGGTGIGYFAGVAGGDLHLVQRHAQLIGHDLRDLDVQALTHFRATVVHLHRAIGVDMHQCTCLVEQRGRKADAELHRRKGNAALQDVVVRIPGLNGLQAFLVLRRLLQFLRHGAQKIVFHAHLVVRDCAWRCGICIVVIAAANLQRVQPQRACNIAHDGLNHDHALRAAKAAKGRVALGVELAAVRGNAHIREEIGIVRMEDGTVGHGAGQVGAKAAVGGHLQLQTGDEALIVKAHIPLVIKGVALAGDHEIIITVQAQLDGAAKLARRKG